MTTPVTAPALRQVRIAVLTYQRPSDLIAALPSLAEQATATSGGVSRTDIVVVDNDPAAGAREAVMRFAAHTEVSVTYLHEAAPGIAHARNLALDNAREVDLLVFIDDDERPSAQWLASMLATYDEHRSAAVVGPVISEFRAELDPWIRAGRFFDRRRRPTGTPVSVAATNNLLLDLHQIRAAGLRFDPEFGLSGGSDTLFTRELHRRGGRLVWCDEAYVTDVVVASRASRSWVMRRALRSGNSWSRTALALSPPGLRLRTRLGLTGQGLLRLAGGATRLGVGVVARSLSQRARGARTLARGLGLLTGAWGYVYQEYRRRPGRAPRERRAGSARARR